MMMKIAGRKKTHAGKNKKSALTKFDGDSSFYIILEPYTIIGFKFYK